MIDFKNNNFSAKCNIPVHIIYADYLPIYLETKYLLILLLDNRYIITWFHSLGNHNINLT